MSEEKAEPAKEKEPKKRGKRKQNSYIVFKQVHITSNVQEPESPDEYVMVAEGASIKSCIKAIEDGKIVGKLVIVCVRRRLLSEVQETLKLT